MKFALSRNRLISLIILVVVVVLAAVLAFPTARNGNTDEAITVTVNFVRATTIQDADAAGSLDGVTSAAYLTIENSGDTDVTLVSVETEVAGMAQIHMTMIEDDVASMSEMTEGVVIPAGETVALEPGGMHVMLMDLTEHLRAGDEVTLTLTFDDETSQIISLPVE